MDKRSIALLVLCALALVGAYWFYYYEADSPFFTGPSGTLVLVAALFLTGFLVRGAPGHKRGGGRHGHDHGHQHGHEHGHEHGHPHGGHDEPGHGHQDQLPLEKQD